MKVELNDQSTLNRENAFGPLFNFFQQRPGLNANTPYEVLEAVAKDFLEATEDPVKQAIKESVYYPNNDLFRFMEVENDREKYMWFYGFQNFYRAVNNALKNYQPQSLKNTGAEPQFILRKDAFKHIGHNEPSIESSRRSYASLFYH